MANAVVRCNASKGHVWACRCQGQLWATLSLPSPGFSHGKHWKSGATVKAGPTVILGTEGQMFSHRSCSKGLQGRKSQEWGQLRLHGPDWWRSTATTPQLPIPPHHWNPSVKQQSRALTQACQIFQLPGVSPEQSWWGTRRSRSSRESLWWPSSGSGSPIFPTLPSIWNKIGANSTVLWMIAQTWLLMPARPWSLNDSPGIRGTWRRMSCPSPPTTHIRSAEQELHAAEDPDHHLNVTYTFCGGDEILFCVSLSKAQLKTTGHSWFF